MSRRRSTAILAPGLSAAPIEWTPPPTGQPAAVSGRAVTTDFKDWNEFAVAAILEIFGGGGAPPFLLRIQTLTSKIRARHVTGAILARFPSVRATIEYFASLSHEKLDNRWANAVRLIGELRYEPERGRHYRRLISERGADRPERGNPRRPPFSPLAMAGTATATGTATEAAGGDAAEDEGCFGSRQDRLRQHSTHRSLERLGDRRQSTSAWGNGGREIVRVRPTPEVARSTNSIRGVVSVAQQHAERFERGEASVARGFSGGSSASFSSLPSPHGAGGGAAGRAASSLSASFTAASSLSTSHRQEEEDGDDFGSVNFASPHRPPIRSSFLAATTNAAAVRSRTRVRAWLERRGAQTG